MRSTAAHLLRCSPIADACIIAAVVVWLGLPLAADRAGEQFVMLLIVPFWLAMLHFFGVYESQRLETMTGLLRKILSAQAAGVAGLALVSSIVAPPEHVGKFAGLLCVCALIIIVEKVVVYGTLHHLRQRGFDRRDVCVIGEWPVADELATTFRQSPAWGFRITCVGVGAAGERTFLRYPSGEHAGGSLGSVLESEVVDEVLLAVSPEQVADESLTLAACDQYGVIGRLLLRGRQSRDAAAVPSVEDVGGRPAVTLSGPTFDARAVLLKRVIDVVLSATLLVILLPLLLAIALMVKLSSSGPIIFRQERIGFHGRRFRLYKFRTMIVGAEAMLPALAHRSVTGGPIFKDPTDVRITRVGRILRRFSLDELPQLLNVLRGDMSLVGPRPLPVHESAAISGAHRRRFAMRPGITCLWQVNGRSDVDYATWMRYDLEYVDKWSLQLDAKLLLQTIPVVIHGRGAY